MKILFFILTIFLYHICFAEENKENSVLLYNVFKNVEFNDIDGKEWWNKYYVVAGLPPIEMDSENNDSSQFLYIALYTLDKKELIAKTFIDHNITWNGGFYFDFAHYYIAESKLCFGIRIWSSYSSTSYSLSNTTLHLFRLKNNKIEDVFIGEVQESYYDKMPEIIEDEGQPIETSSKVIIIIQKNKTKGYFDLLLKTFRDLTYINDRKIKSKNSKIFRWDGSKYKLDYIETD